MTASLYLMRQTTLLLLLLQSGRTSARALLCRHRRQHINAIPAKRISLEYQDGNWYWQ